MIIIRLDGGRVDGVYSDDRSMVGENVAVLETQSDCADEVFVKAGAFKDDLIYQYESVMHVTRKDVAPVVAAVKEYIK